LLFKSCEVRAAVLAAAHPDPLTGKPLEGNPEYLGFSATLRWIWEKNKYWHDFFIEESFPITWTYDYAIPWGSIYRLNPHKLDGLSQDVVDRDFTYWKNYKDRLLSDPLFLKDLDARRTFCRLRATIGNIYRYRKMYREAEHAYSEALEIYPADGPAILGLMNVLWELGKFGEAIDIVQVGIHADSRCDGLHSLLKLAETRKELQDRVVSLQSRLSKLPSDKNARKQIVMILAGVGDLAKANEIMIEGIKRFRNDPDYLRFAAAHDVINGQPLNSLGPALQLARIEPNNPDNLYILSHALYYHKKYEQFFKVKREAIRLGGEPMKKMFDADPIFAPIRSHEEFKK